MALGRACLFPPPSSDSALVAQPWLRFHTPLIGRVEDWRAGLGRGRRAVRLFTSTARFILSSGEQPHCGP